MRYISDIIDWFGWNSGWLIDLLPLVLCLIAFIISIIAIII